MHTQIFPSQYKDQQAITIQSDAISAQFLPSVGAKLASLVYKPRKYELFVQRPGREYLLQPFDGDYVAGECSGMDDMFPTIDVCYYDRYPWAGTKMADHGEVWSLSWDLSFDDDYLNFAVNGVRFPYRLEKRISFTNDETLHIDYRLTNLSAFDLDCMWAAHPMFNITEGTELVLPGGIDSIVFTFNMGSDQGKYGDEFSWPQAVMPDGSQIDFRKIRPPSTRQAYKYYIKGKLPQGWCGLIYHKLGFVLQLTFPVDQVPYLGVLPNEGGWQDLYNIFLEPCTAPFDRPDAARYRNQGSTLRANSTWEWFLDITLKEGAAISPL